MVENRKPQRLHVRSSKKPLIIAGVTVAAIVGANVWSNSHTGSDPNANPAPTETVGTLEPVPTTETPPSPKLKTMRRFVCERVFEDGKTLTVRPIVDSLDSQFPSSIVSIDSTGFELGPPAEHGVESSIVMFDGKTPAKEQKFTAAACAEEEISLRTIVDSSGMEVPVIVDAEHASRVHDGTVIDLNSLAAIVGNGLVGQQIELAGGAS